MSIISRINWKRLASVFLPGLLIASISIYVLGFRAAPSPDFKVLPGKALAAYDDFYPIRADDGGALYLDRELFVKASTICQHTLRRALWLT